MKERQIALYNYLLSRNGEWTTHAEIARELYREYGNAECCLEPKDYHNTSERIEILKTCRDINSSYEFDKIIISGSKGIKLATEEEFNKYIRNQYRAIFRKLKRTRELERKAIRNNQINFMGNFVEAFLKDITEKFEIDIDK
jgi:hypothetical protein